MINKISPMSRYDYLIAVYEYTKNVERGNLVSVPWKTNILSTKKGLVFIDVRYKY